MSTDHITADWLRDAVKRLQNPDPPQRVVYLLHPELYAYCVEEGMISASDPSWATTQNLPTAHDLAYAANLPSFYQIARIYEEWIENARQNASQRNASQDAQGNATRQDADERPHDV